MKRIASFLLAIIILSGSIAAASYIPQDVKGTEFEDDVELLINLGFIEYTEYGMLKPYSHMTRADYAVLLGNVLKNKNYSDKDVFSDVGKDHYARGSILRLYEAGYISGDGNSRFRPDDDIKYDEALKIMISLLGYDAFADEKGGYPQGSTNIAISIGITKGVVPDGEYISRGNAMKLLVNSFEANPVNLSFFAGNPVLTIQSEETMLSKIADIEYVKEYVNANADYAITGPVAGDGHLYIGREKMAASPEYYDYVGYQVECWYRKNDYDEKEVLYLKKTSLNAGLVRVNAEDISAVENYVCKYYDGSKTEKRIKFSGETIFIYNGKRCMAFYDSLLDFNNGWVEFVDNDSDGKSDLVRIYNYFDIVVESVTDDKIYSKYTPENSLNFEETEIQLFDEEGKEIAVSDIAKDDVLSVFKSDDSADALIKVIRSRKTLSGEITDKKYDDGKTYVTIAYKDYILYDGYKTLISNDVAIKDSGEFLLDAYGKIVSVKGMASSNYMPGFLIRVWYDIETNSGVIGLKMLTTGGVVSLNSANRLKVDTKRYNAGDFNELAKSLQAKVGELILYKTNAEGYITSIDTTDQNVAGSSEDRLVVGPSVASSESLRYQSSTRVIEGRFPLDENAKTFVVPANISTADDSQFKVKSTSEIGNGSYISGAVAYKTDSNKMTADYLVMQGSTKSVNHESDIAVVKKISKAVNKDDETSVLLKLDVFGKEKTLYTKNMEVLSSLKYLTKYSRNGDTLVDFTEATMPTVKKGDIIKYSLDADGYIDAIIMVYSADTEKMHSRNPYHNDFHEQGYRYVRGVVKEIYGEYVMLDVNNGERTECHRIGNVDIYEVKTGEKEIFNKISMSGIGVGDAIIVFMGSGKQIMTLLYR